jgi:hypothetical protein
MPRRNRVYKLVRRPRVALALTVALLSLVGLSYLAHAQFTNPLTTDVAYPENTIGNITVQGIGTHQVFRPNAVSGPAVPAIGVFANLNPKNGTCPNGGMVVFLHGDQNAIGVDDFVYALRVNNTTPSDDSLDTILTGACAKRASITSIGYCALPGSFNPTGSNMPPAIAGIDFFFENGSVIPPAGSSAVLFYTSPDPPQRRPTSVATSGVVSQGTALNDNTNTLPIYGACPTSIEVDKKIGCANTGPFADNLSVTASTQVFYQVTIKNTGETPLNSILVTDAQLGGVLPFPGLLNPGEMATQVFGPLAATATGTNTVTASGEYLILDLNGVPTGQSFPTSDIDSATLTVGTVNECGAGTKCDTVCFRAPQYYALNLNRLPNGTVIIGGLNFNNPLSIQAHIPAIKQALQGGGGPLQQLNQEYVAAQLSLAAAGGSSSAPVMNGLWSQIKCYQGGLQSFAPVILGNGAVLTPESMLKELFMQAELAIRQNRTADMLKLVPLFDLLNGNDPTGRCG